tara:strand:+ start:10551 stop:11681 length:1131 start_codon:yes stop_codon:yes gene_type:complete
MILDKVKKITLAQFIVISGLCLRLLQVLKETYYLNVFEKSDDLSFYISFKANMDVFLILTSSIFFFESCYKKLKISIPILPIIASLIFGLFFSYQKFSIIENYSVFLLVFTGCCITVFSNSIVILSKESRKLIYNLFANGFENYILIMVILSFILLNVPPNFILFTTILIITQIFISFLIYTRLKKLGFSISASFGIKDSINSIPKIFGATIILIVMIITRSLYELNNDIIILNYSLIIATAPLLLIERYFEYSSDKSFKNNIKLINLTIILTAINLLGVFFLYINYIHDIINNFQYGKILFIIVKSMQYFLFLLPTFIYFILLKNKYSFNKNSIIIVLISCALVLFVTSNLRSDFFLLFSSICSSVFLIKFYVKN